MKTDERLARAIRLLEILSSAPENRIPLHAAADELHVKRSDLEQIVELIAGLADRKTGARAIAYIEGNDIVLEGSAAELRPLRLNPNESMLLAHLLSTLSIDAGTAERISRTLLPEERAERTSIASTSSYGASYPELAAALEDGVRCIISYRSAGEGRSRERRVDPISMEQRDGVVYLLAWDVDADGPRRYRMDRIAGARMTEDSVERHGAALPTAERSLAEAGRPVRLLMPREAAEGLTWAGITQIQEGETPDEAIVQVNVTSETWLFDAVLAGAGSIRILDDPELAERLCARGRSLLELP